MQTHDAVALALADVTNAVKSLCHRWCAHIAQQLQDAVAVRTLQELREGVKAAGVRGGGGGAGSRWGAPYGGGPQRAAGQAGPGAVRRQVLTSKLCC